MPLLPDLRSLLVGALIGLLIGGGAAWTINGWRLNSKYDSAQREIAEKHSKAITKARTAEFSAVIRLADISGKLHTAEEKNAHIENERDAAIAAGAKRVYVRAKYTGLPADATAPGGIDATSPELDPAYRQTLSDLRRGVADGAAQITALQQYAQLCRSIHQ